MARLRAAFKRRINTAGNASAVVDGAAAMIIGREADAKVHDVRPLAESPVWALRPEPAIMGWGRARNGKGAGCRRHSGADIDHVELNKLCPQAIAVIRDFVSRALIRRSILWAMPLPSVIRSVSPVIHFDVRLCPAKKTKATVWSPVLVVDRESPWCSKRFKATGAKAQNLSAVHDKQSKRRLWGYTMRYMIFAALLLCACDDSTGSGTDVPTQTAGEPGKPGLNSGGSTDDPMGGHSTGGVPTIGDTDQPSPGGSSQLCMPGQPLQCVTDAVRLSVTPRVPQADPSMAANVKRVNAWATYHHPWVVR